MRSTGGWLHRYSKPTWLRLIKSCKEVEGRTSMKLKRPFTVRYNGDCREVIPAGTEVVFWCLYKGSKGTTKKFRIEGTFYLADGRTISILGYYDRKVPKGRERDYLRKSVEIKDPAANARRLIDALPRSREYVLA